jgi:RNA polymerase sigma-70 factor (ECF subfamily)
MSPTMTPTILNRVEPLNQLTAVAEAPPPARLLDPESREWLRCLRDTGVTRDDAIGRLHALLLKAARFEVSRRTPTLPHLRGNEFDDIDKKPRTTP